MSYLAKPNSFHMTDQKIQDALDKQNKQRELRAQLDGQLAARGSSGDYGVAPGIGHQHGMMGGNPNGPNGGGGYPGQAQGPSGYGLTKMQQKRLQINREREMEETMQRTQQQGGQPSHNGLYNTDTHSTAQRVNPYALQQAPPSSHGGGGHPQQRLLNNHPTRQSSIGGHPQDFGGTFGHQQQPQQFQTYQHSQQQSVQPHFGGGGYGEGPEPSLSSPTYVGGGGTGVRGGSGSALPQLPTGRSSWNQQDQQQPGVGGGGFQGTFQVPPSQHKPRGPAPMTAPYEVQEESIYALNDQKENDSRHKELMSLVGRVQDVSAVVAATSGGGAEQPVGSGRGRRGQQQGGERGGGGGPSSPRQVDPREQQREQLGRPSNPVANKQRGTRGGPAEARQRGESRSRDEHAGAGAGGHLAARAESREARGGGGSRQRTESKDPVRERRREDAGAKAKQQKLEKELVSHQSAIEKMREKEKNWEKQVAKLKDELKHAKTKEKVGGRPLRAETAPNDSLKTREQLRAAPGVKAPAKKNIHHVQPLRGAAPVGGENGSGNSTLNDFNDAVRYSQDKPFRPITAPNLDSTGGSGHHNVVSYGSDHRSAPPLPPLMASRDAMLEGTYTGGQNVSSGPPPMPVPGALSYDQVLPGSPLNNVANPQVPEPVSPPKTKSSKTRQQPVQNTPEKDKLSSSIYSPPVAPPPPPVQVLDTRTLRGLVSSGVVTVKQAEGLWELLTGDKISVAPTPPLAAPPSPGVGYSRPSRRGGKERSVDTYDTFDSFDQGQGSAGSDGEDTVRSEIPHHGLETQRPPPAVLGKSTNSSSGLNVEDDGVDEEEDDGEEEENEEEEDEEEEEEEEEEA